MIDFRTAVAASVDGRTARGMATRETILDAAQELFVAEGFRAVSLRDIAARAGISHPGVLRHFPSADAILDAVVDRFEEFNERWNAEHDRGLAGFAVLARHNADTPGYVELFATLAGEATSAEHPSHTRFQQRYRRIRDLTEKAFLRAMTDEGGLPGVADPAAEATRILAAWDGLQVISLYLPDRIDVSGMLERHMERLSGIAGSSEARLADAPPLTPLTSILPRVFGYESGRKRRTRIVADATALFASGGFHTTSLREIAEKVGIGKSTLLHHFSTKDELLTAVLLNRDAAMVDRVAAPAATARDELMGIAKSARRNTREEPGLVELYAVLSCEGAAVSHPAHDYFTWRFDASIGYFTNVFARAAAEGAIDPDLDPAFEATWLIALWDGLQYQWLYDRDAIDIAALLDDHIAHLLVPEVAALG
ncbi:TetR/AcrR family transcriptional regulator [Luethyella okanaganae]|uniref:TetR/AcrR family transcriptional regulator n=1 Tax=Luethyella okanaganae TaxID=69372 RepID=A0ABW1VFK4_9MICO